MCLTFGCSKLILEGYADADADADVASELDDRKSTSDSYLLL